MGFLPVIRASRLIPVLVRAGFRIMRQAGSHVHLEHVLNKVHKVTVPMHNKDLPPKTLLSILKQAGISIKEFLKLIGRK